MIQYKIADILKKWFLLLLFLGYYSCISLFYHSHIIDGVIISHSHPYRNSQEKKWPNSSHRHSSTTLILIKCLNEINHDTVFEDIRISVPEFLFIAFTEAFSANAVASDLYFVSPSRAPPAQCVVFQA